MFETAESVVLLELGTEQVRQILRITLSIGIVCDYDARVAGVSCNFFNTKELSLTYTIPGCYNQLHPEGSQKVISVYTLHTPTAFKKIFLFHPIMFVEQLKSYK